MLQRNLKFYSAERSMHSDIRTLIMINYMQQPLPIQAKPITLLWYTRIT